MQNEHIGFNSSKILWRHGLMKRRAALRRCHRGFAWASSGGPKYLHDEWKLAKQIHIQSRMHMLDKLVDKRLSHSRTATAAPKLQKLACSRFLDDPHSKNPWSCLQILCIWHTIELLFAQFSDMHPRTARLGELYISEFSYLDSIKFTLLLGWER